MNEVAEIAEAEIVEVAALQVDPLLVLIERVILDPALPIERIQAVLDLRERQMAKDAEMQFNQDFAKAMAEMPTVPRTGTSNRNTYSTIDDIIKTVRPVLSKYGFSLNWESDTDLQDRIVKVTAIVRHKLGHTIRTTHTGGFDKSGDNDNQKARSTETYLKRYSGTSILGLSSGEEVEDDGQALGPTISEEQLADLRALIEESGADESKFCQHLKVNQLPELAASRFNYAVTALRRKIAMQKSEQGDDQ